MRAITQQEVVDGLRQLGLDSSSDVLVHASLRSFGWVDGGAEAVCAALTRVCGTVLIAAAASDLTRVPAPPGLVRPHNACHNAESWDEFENALARAVPFTQELPVDRWLGRIADTMRASEHARSDHPLFSYLAAGTHAQRLIDAQRLDWALGPIAELEKLDGDVLLVGVGHTSNTTIHLAEQRLGRSNFYRYAKSGPGLWMELPNIAGESHRFDDIEPELAPVTREVQIGESRVRRVSVRDVLACTTHMVEADPAALLCHEDPECRCAAALQQRLAATG